MAMDDYVAVAADDWYQRRREDAEGAFFRKVADQGPRKGENGATRQGIYCFTADGQLLAYKNAGQAPDVMRDTLRQALRDWRSLPETRRKPDAVKVPDAGKADARYTRTPPPGGLIVNVYTRILDERLGQYCQGHCTTPGGAKAARDHLWLTAREVSELAPANPAVGTRLSPPDSLVERILRFHLNDNTRGEPPFWQPEDIRTRHMTLTVVEVSAARLRLRLEGAALLAKHLEVAKANRGFDVRLVGEIRYDRAKKIIDGFDAVAIGEHWGEGVYTPGARKGRQPLGIAFELAGADGYDRVPPQAARDLGAYLSRGQ